MWATQPRTKPCAASHSLSLAIASPATRFTTGSFEGSAVAMPPIGTAPRLREIARSEEHTSELQSRLHLVCRLLLEKKKCTRTHDTLHTDRRQHDNNQC